MSTAKREMPELTDDEFAEWQERMMHEVYFDDRHSDAEAARDDMRDAERNPHANPKCPYCHGSGTVTDWVDYGSTTVPMESPCDCVLDGEAADVDDDDGTVTMVIHNGDIVTMDAAHLAEFTAEFGRFVDAYAAAIDANRTARQAAQPHIARWNELQTIAAEIYTATNDEPIF